MRLSNENSRGSSRRKVTSRGISRGKLRSRIQAVPNGIDVSGIHFTLDPSLDERRSNVDPQVSITDQSFNDATLSGALQFALKGWDVASRGRSSFFFFSLSLFLCPFFRCVPFLSGRKEGGDRGGVRGGPWTPPPPGGRLSGGRLLIAAKISFSGCVGV